MREVRWARFLKDARFWILCRCRERNVAYGIERDRSFAGPPRLQRLDLLSQDDREIATLDSYEGGLSISPSGNKLAYYIDKAVLEVRDLTSPENFVRVRIGLGVFHWGPTRPDCC